MAVEGGPARQNAPARPLLRPVVLVGLMGSGKSSVGKVLAGGLGVGFRDSDHEIEAAAARSVTEIFEEFGEGEFRALERRVIARLMAGEPAVLATGGGAFMDAETRALILRSGAAVWLKAGLEVLLSRVTGRTHRPLLNRGDPREILSALIERRYPVYAEAPVAVESRIEQTHADMAERIVAALEASGLAVFGEA